MTPSAIGCRWMGFRARRSHTHTPRRLPRPAIAHPPPPRHPHRPWGHPPCREEKAS